MKRNKKDKISSNTNYENFKYAEEWNDLYNEGLTFKVIADMYNVSRPTVQRVLYKFNRKRNTA